MERSILFGLDMDPLGEVGWLRVEMKEKYLRPLIKALAIQGLHILQKILWKSLDLT